MTTPVTTQRVRVRSAARLAATEARVQVRSGIPAGTAVATVAWGLVLVAVPATARPGVLPWVLLLDVTALGFFTAPSLAVVERTTGVTAVHAVAGASAGAALGRRLGLLATWSMASTAVLVALAGVAGPLLVVLAAGVATWLFALVSLATLGREDTLVAWMPRVPLVAVPLVVPALLVATGASTAGVWDLSPATVAWRWMAGAPSAWGVARGVAWVLGWVVVLFGVVAGTGWVLPGRSRAVGRPTRPFAGWVESAGGSGRSRWTCAVRSLARVDRRTLGDDRLLAMLAAGVPLLAVLVRVGLGPALDLLSTRTGVDLAPDLAAVWALLLVVHTATMMGTIAGLMVLEDRDVGALAALGTTPRGIATMLAWRLGAAGTATAVLVVVGVVVADGAAAAGPVGLLATALAAGVVAGLPTVLMATLARDRVAGVVVMKAITLPLYLPVAWWWLGDAPAAWLLGLVPTAWPARALWATTPAGALACLAAAMVTGGVVVTLGARRIVARTAAPA